MNSPDSMYFSLIDWVMEKGDRRQTRSGEVLSCFSLFYDWDMQDGFPLLQSKKINFNNVMHELNWFLRGETNINTLKAPQIWAPWANEYGECNGIYGENWRYWGRYAQHGLILATQGGFDQITALIEGLKKDPYGRRHLVSAWNPMQAYDTPEVPNACHTMFQCYVRQGFLDLQMYQRSADLAVAVPYNIASYALLLMMLAEEVDLAPGKLHIVFGDAHIYSNHIDNLKKQLTREVKLAPKLTLKKSFWDLVNEDSPDNYELTGYNPDGFLKYEAMV